MRDRRDLLAAFAALRASGGHGALATVVRVVGSAYRRPGARMLLGVDGTRVGLVSGGCLEADLVERARPVLESGTPALVTYDASRDEDLVFGLGLGCEGTVEVLIERVPERPDGGHLALLARCLEERRRLALVTLFRTSGVVAPGTRLFLVDGEPEGGGPVPDALAVALGREADAALADGRHRNVSVEDGAGARVEALVEPILPWPELFVFGAGPDALPVVRLAVALGFDVTVADHRPAFVRPERFPGAVAVVLCEPAEIAATVDPGPDAAVLVMSHSFVSDRAYLGQLLRRPLRYLGALGPKRRTERILAELAAEGVVPDASARARFHAPVGLDLGAETPEEIALSILAEIRAVWMGRAGGPLRDREAPIHGDAGTPR